MFGGRPTIPFGHLEPTVERRSVDGQGWSVVAPYQPREKKIRVGGLDLGQANDRSAMVVLERRAQDPDFVGPSWPYVTLQKIRRYPQDADYTLQVDNVLAYPDLDFLVVEYNGVGRPVVDQLRKRAREVDFQGRIIPIITVASNARLHEVSDSKGTTISVPKINLVSSINLLVQSGRFKIPQRHDDPETKDNLKVLSRELRNFQMRITKNANVVFGNVEGAGQHDDLVMGLGLACWFMLNKARREPTFYMP